MSGPIPELQRVVLTADLPQHGLKTGDVGTIVHAAAGGSGYLVEFCTLTGKTVAVAPVTAGQVRPVEASEVSSARRIAG
jgi:hypothetical protein